MLDSPKHERDQLRLYRGLATGSPTSRRTTHSYWFAKGSMQRCDAAQVPLRASCHESPLARDPAHAERKSERERASA